MLFKISNFIGLLLHKLLNNFVRANECDIFTDREIFFLIFVCETHF